LFCLLKADQKKFLSAFGWFAGQGEHDNVEQISHAVSLIDGLRDCHDACV
jgi:hypothetical protein